MRARARFVRVRARYYTKVYILTQNVSFLVRMPISFIMAYAPWALKEKPEEALAVNKRFNLSIFMRKICRNLVSPFMVENTQCCEFQAVGQRVRDALDMQVDPNIHPMPLAFDEESDGDQVDPVADPRADPMQVAESLVDLSEKINSGK